MSVVELEMSQEGFMEPQWPAVRALQGKTLKHLAPPQNHPVSASNIGTTP